MPLFNKLSQYLFPSYKKETEPGEAYDRWSHRYDNQPENLLLVLDEQLFCEMLNGTTLTGKVIIDIGCGTGRHWEKVLDKNPAKLSGYDVSAGMLDILRQKYPGAGAYLLTDERLYELGTGTCDRIISTLTIGYIPDITSALTEWCRVLRPGGEIIFTDYHPEALARGAKRTFFHEKEVIAIRNYLHPIRKINEIARQLHLQILRFSERKIDDSVKPYYEQQKALPVFERFYGVPIIYGIHLKKSDAVT
jgi:ubiquinone/menaquinone biosynthesis C-methylase UbiE